ncbi:hypothetical protein Vadar_015487 [Vaccinium darrowii]|uniref:Uncharacterized protein n=1 Tax=Vaccinium darrowii TaxID=229202 RepID=A0ACB7XHV6_9ERIC|nr:hypothetical protein Vadar_015487 [Vaccinium darrowii]
MAMAWRLVCAMGSHGKAKNTIAQVWAVLKPGFLALLKEPLNANPSDIIVFDVLLASDGNGEGRVSLATVEEPSPLTLALDTLAKKAQLHRKLWDKFIRLKAKVSKRRRNLRHGGKLGPRHR